MKSFIAMVAALALPLAVMAPARADSFAYTGSIQTYTVTETGIYSFSLTGAEGGAGHSTSPGLGAVLSGDYVLYSGQTLEIVVGQQGVNSIEMNAGGGGGGTFIYVSGSDQLVAVAGGGGGGGYYAAPGGTAQTGTTGGSSSGAGGSSGSGGAGGTATGGGNGGGGGGFSGTGGNGTGSNSGGGGGGGFSFAGGSSSYAAGGYGGGGGSGQFGGGGGGGYSGGGGGGGAYPGGGGGGGGSYLNPSFTGASYAATHTGNGTAAINLVAVIVPEPSTILMLGTGMAGLAIYVGRRRRVA